MEWVRTGWERGERKLAPFDLRRPSRKATRSGNTLSDALTCNNMRTVLATTFWTLMSYFAQALVILYPPVFVFWIIIHTKIDYWRTMGKRAYGYALLAWPLISGPLFLMRHSVFSVRWPVPWWLAAMGAVALAASVRIFSLASHVISRRTLLGLVELEPQQNPQPVMQTGIYSKTRNPVYLAHWLLIVGAAAISGFAANWILVAAEVFLLAVLIRTEEKELLSRYGNEYASYMQRVPRFFPRRTW
jgi:protein-S-isoprenylcysteine O-methyltransferase Ste14